MKTGSVTSEQWKKLGMAYLLAGAGALAFSALVGTTKLLTYRAENFKTFLQPIEQEVQPKPRETLQQKETPLPQEPESTTPKDNQVINKNTPTYRPEARKQGEEYVNDITPNYDIKTRGIANKNPGNIVYTGIPWQGLIGSDEKGFCVFESHRQGIRAIAKNLTTYRNKHGADTVEEIISRWAPPKANNTARYIRDVARETGYSPKQKLDLRNHDTLTTLTMAIAKYDSGAIFKRGDVRKAVRSALN